MQSNSSEPMAELKTAAVEVGDSQQITDLIEQLDRDLEETQKKAPKPR